VCTGKVEQIYVRETEGPLLRQALHHGVGVFLLFKWVRKNEPRNQFHQHFTGSNFPNILSQKIQIQTVNRENIFKTLPYKKSSLKMLVKGRRGNKNKTFDNNRSLDVRRREQCLL
jgi:hypothetical protein